tara:strand:+ start:8384 stop:8803 length:420 start_codon:yes stop_codon:yes gene_type:complete
MLSIFKKKLFSDISGNAEDMPPHVSAVLCLMIEIARMDGKIDEDEIKEIKDFYLDLYPSGNFSEAFKELKDWTSHKESFNPFINIINSNCSKKMKIEILSNIWNVILSDDHVDQYENSLFMQIGEMLLISKNDLENIKN